MKILSIEQLTKLCCKWQRKLGLSHWTIGLRICHSNEIQAESTQATNKISLTNECALISILDSEDYPDTPFQQDMEVSLVHELLHIPFMYIADPDEGTLEHIHMEAFIERLARLLVKQTRNKKGKA